LTASYNAPSHKIVRKSCYHEFAIDTSRYAILKFNDRDSLFGKGCKPTVLTSSDIKKIEDLISKTIAQYNKMSKGSWKIKHIHKYYKQLIAVVNANGEKEVWVNCLCNVSEWGSKGPNWKHDVVEVMDGGPCYFNLKINLSKGTAYTFSVNGVG
jgi:hypothetical protein